MAKIVQGVAQVVVGRVGRSGQCQQGVHGVEKRGGETLKLSPLERERLLQHLAGALQRDAPVEVVRGLARKGGGVLRVSREDLPLEAQFVHAHGFPFFGRKVLGTVPVRVPDGAEPPVTLDDFPVEVRATAHEEDAPLLVGVEGQCVAGGEDGRHEKSLERVVDVHFRGARHGHDGGEPPQRIHARTDFKVLFGKGGGHAEENAFRRLAEGKVATDDGRVRRVTGGQGGDVGGFPRHGGHAAQAHRGGRAAGGGCDGAEAVAAGRETEVQRDTFVAASQGDGAFPALQFDAVVGPEIVPENGEAFEERVSPLRRGRVGPATFQAADASGGLQGQAPCGRKTEEYSFFHGLVLCERVAKIMFWHRNCGSRAEKKEMKA